MYVGVDFFRDTEELRKKMKIENVKKDIGTCFFCGSDASIRLDNILHCTDCADAELIKQIGRCVKAVKHAKITMKIVPKKCKI